MPKVSFVIPVYDGDAYLAETLESIRNQKEKDIEIIVIDDCSPDYTPDLMDYYKKVDPRIKYHRFETNQGVCEARNYGNRLATSEIICVSDQDDLSQPIRASFSYGYLTHHPQIDCLTSAYWETNVHGVQIRQWRPKDITRESFLDGSYLDTGGWMHSSACYRKKDIVELPYRMEEGKTDDHVFLDDWTKAGKKFRSTKLVLTNCRRLPWGVMQQRRNYMGAEPSYIL